MPPLEAKAAKGIGQLADNGMLVSSLQAALSRADTNVRTVPLLVRQLAAQDAWREFVFADRPEKVHRWKAADFRRFVESPRPAGCGTPLYVLERLLRDTDAWLVFLELTRGEPGAPEGNQNNTSGVNQYSGEERTNCDNITVCPPADPAAPPPTGTSVAYTVRRLSRERPDLLARVEAGEMSANAAAIEAGFRERQLTIPADPRKAGRYLAKHFTSEQFSAMIDAAIDWRKEVGL
jgi:hypothetical protein